jgi:uroporphyrin-3 C-methyltransferase
MSKNKSSNKTKSVSSEPVANEEIATSKPADIADDDASNKESPEQAIILESEEQLVSSMPSDPINEPSAKSDKSKLSPPPKPADKSKSKRWFALLSLLNLLLILGLIGAAAYYWQLQQQSDAENQALVLKLRSQLDSKASLPQIQSQLAPLKSGIGSSAARIEALQKQQQGLQASTEKLFDMYSQGKSDWQLAEVAYLMRIAQHKLALENDFEGAALTLQAASNKIAETADPGFLPVRVLISEEIAALKTRARPDLVGMTLLLSQLGQQIRQLKPGYQPASDMSIPSPENAPAAPAPEKSIEDKVKSFFSNLVTLKHNKTQPTTTEALIINIEEIMEGNLKLTRWTLLERDDFQYRQLMQENIRLFKKYYNLDDAANNDFYTQLLQLQKSPLKPQKPAIDGSLQLLKNILSQRENAPGANGKNKTEPEAVSEAADNV